MNLDQHKKKITVVASFHYGQSLMSEGFARLQYNQAVAKNDMVRATTIKSEIEAIKGKRMTLIGLDQRMKLMGKLILVDTIPPLKNKLEFNTQGLDSYGF